MPQHLSSETIQNLREREELPINNPPRYISTFKQNVRMEYAANKKANKTMGNAQELLPHPTNFLKKQSRKFDHQTFTSNCCLLDKRPPIPKNITHRNTKRENKDFLKENIRVIKSASCPNSSASLKFVDTYKGSVQFLAKSGLKPHYVFKKNFGSTPRFITEKLKSVEQKGDVEAKNICDKEYNMHTKLNEEERNKLLQGLKKKLEEKNKEFLLLPVIIDTPFLINYKRKLEKSIIQLEKDVENIENHTVIYICNN